MPKFLVQSELYRLIQRELPPDNYADGAPSAFFTTADSDSTAKVLDTFYQKMERVYDNYFPYYADESIGDWEKFVFGAEQSGLTLQERRQRVVNQLRARPSLSLWEMLTTAANFVPPGTFVQIVEWGCNEATEGWKLGVSKLGSQTVLSWGLKKIGVDGANLCPAMIGNGWRLGESPLGSGTRLGGTYSYKEITEAQMRAYVFEIRVFGYTLSEAERKSLGLLIRRKEPARSGHIIMDGLNLTAYNLTVPVLEAGQFSNVDCIAVDGTQSTGYVGRTTP